MLIRSRGILEHEMWDGKIEVSPPAQDSFFFKVFEANRETANSVLHTEYLEAIKRGVLTS